MTATNAARSTSNGCSSAGRALMAPRMIDRSSSGCPALPTSSSLSRAADLAWTVVVVLLWAIAIGGVIFVVAATFLD